MKRSTSRLAATVLVFLVACFLVHKSPGQDQLAMLLDRLDVGPFDVATLYSLEGQPEDPRTLPALRVAFERSTEKAEKQWIASTLLRLGDRSERYFDFLASYARIAVDNRTPSFAKYDSNGNGIRGQFSTEFLNWCAISGDDPRVVAALQVGVYPNDVMLLASAEDSRARDLFRTGLESPNPLVVGYSVQGLGRLQDLAAIPLISRAAGRMHAVDRVVVSMNLPWYSRSEAFQLMGYLTPDLKMRGHLTEQVQQRQIDELNRTLSRRRQQPQK